MTTPQQLERQFTLITAAARYDELRTRDALAPPADTASPDTAAPGATTTHPGAAADLPPDPDEPAALTQGEALEMLALGEVIARKAGYGRQLSVRTARAVGASWTQIGQALGTTKQSAWEAHARWIDDQAEQHRQSGYEGWDNEQVSAARALAGQIDDTGPAGRTDSR